MRSHEGIIYSIPTINAILERNDLRELTKLFHEVAIGEISYMNRDWHYQQYLNLRPDKGALPTRCKEYAMCGQILDSILTHKDWINRVRIKRDMVLSLAELN